MQHLELKCDSCEKSFRQTGDLDKHVNTIHENIKDHECESCEKSFLPKGRFRKTFQNSSWKYQRF